MKVLWLHAYFQPCPAVREGDLYGYIDICGPVQKGVDFSWNLKQTHYDGLENPSLSSCYQCNVSPQCHYCHHYHGRHGNHVAVVQEARWLTSSPCCCHCHPVHSMKVFWSSWWWKRCSSWERIKAPLIDLVFSSWCGKKSSPSCHHWHPYHSIIELWSSRWKHQDSSLEEMVTVVQEENQSRWLTSILYLMWKEIQSLLSSSSLLFCLAVIVVKLVKCIFF